MTGALIILAPTCEAVAPCLMGQAKEPQADVSPHWALSYQNVLTLRGKLANVPTKRFFLEGETRNNTGSI